MNINNNDAPYARMLFCQLGARFTISISSPIIFKSIVFLLFLVVGNNYE